MSQVPSNPVPAPPSRDVSGAIKSSAINLLIGGAVCLYFGLTLAADAPAAAKTREAVERWWAVDNAFFWSLRGLGGLFILISRLVCQLRDRESQKDWGVYRSCLLR